VSIELSGRNGWRADLRYRRSAKRVRNESQTNHWRRGGEFMVGPDSKVSAATVSW
jgi:hypothetical protein